jgi:hypothetical protein
MNDSEITQPLQIPAKPKDFAELVVKITTGEKRISSGRAPGPTAGSRGEHTTPSANAPIALVGFGTTPPPAKLLFQKTERFFDLWSVGVVRLDCTRSEGEVVRPPIATAVFDHQHGMSDRPQVALRRSIAMRPGRAERPCI